MTAARTSQIHLWVPQGSHMLVHVLQVCHPLWLVKTCQDEREKMISSCCKSQRRCCQWAHNCLFRHCCCDAVQIFQLSLCWKTALPCTDNVTLTNINADLKFSVMDYTVMELLGKYKIICLNLQLKIFCKNVKSTWFVDKELKPANPLHYGSLRHADFDSAGCVCADKRLFVSLGALTLSLRIRRGRTWDASDPGKSV